MVLQEEESFNVQILPLMAQGTSMTFKVAPVANNILGQSASSKVPVWPAA